MRSARRSVLLLGSLLLTALLFWRPPVPVHVDAEPDELQPTRTVPPVALLAAFAVIALASMLWLAAQQWSEASERYTSARALTGGDPARAAPLMIRYGCAGCHTIPGVPGADGQVAGPLTDMRKHVFIAGVIPNTASNLIGWIVQPQAHDPRSAMPITGISHAEARDVAAWLYSR
jgi:mono/diheme cytochrome c family protein